MTQLRKFSLKYFSAAVLAVVIFCTLTWKTAAANVSEPFFYSTLTTQQDTIKPILKNDSLRKRNFTDSIIINAAGDTVRPTQKIDTFSFKMSKDSLDAPVHYEAEDSAVVLVQEKKILLYGKTKTEYKDITLTAPRVEIDQQTQILTAYNSVDSSGDIVERAKFKDKDSEFESDTIRFNFKTQKGITKNTFTQQGGIFIQSKLSKKVNATTMYAKNGIMTTCDLDDPHFGFHYNRIKVINNKLAVSGLIYPEFEGVPIPIALPFGIFPLKTGRHSGFLPPQFTTNEQYGLGLEGLGYYQVLNQHFDVTLRGNIYSYGGWSASLTPSYRKRYKYNGAMNFTIQSTKINFKGDPDFSKNTSYFINWNHTVDSRARPGTNFSANVSAGSTKFNRYVPNSPQRNFQNQLTSSITYSKTGTLEGLGEWWKDKQYNLTVSGNHNQNDLLHLINLNLPNVGFNITTLYPFQKKEFIGSPKWYEKLGISYSGNFTNNVSFYDTLKYGRNGVKPFFKYLLDTAQWTAHHSIPVTLSLPPILGGAVMVSPSVSYGQDWMQRIIKYRWNPVTEKIDTSSAKGIFIDQRASLSLDFNTALFGTYEFRRAKKILAIRHVVRPTLGFSYTPDLNKKYLQEIQLDTTGRKLLYNQMGGGILSYTGSRKFAGLTFAVVNTLEMKTRSKKDTSNGGIKKIKLIDGYGFSTSYDLRADSFALTNPNFYLHTTLFEKISITANALLNPYDYDTKGFPVNKLFSRRGKFYLGRITSGSISASTDFQSKPKDAQKEAARKKQMNEILTDPNLVDQQNLLDYMRQNPAEFVDFNVPWKLGLGLSIYFNEEFRLDSTGVFRFQKKFSSSLNFNGSFNLTPKWNFSVNGYYDLKTTKLQTFQMNISREMHCWQMSISITPVGLYRFFSINISPKASILQDLKINRTRYFSNF